MKFKIEKWHVIVLSFAIVAVISVSIFILYANGVRIASIENNVIITTTDLISNYESTQLLYGRAKTYYDKKDYPVARNMLEMCKNDLSPKFKNTLLAKDINKMYNDISQKTGSQGRNSTSATPSPKTAPTATAGSYGLDVTQAIIIGIAVISVVVLCIAVARKRRRDDVDEEKLGGVDVKMPKYFACPKCGASIKSGTDICSCGAIIDTNITDREMLAMTVAYMRIIKNCIIYFTVISIIGILLCWAIINNAR